MIINKILCKRIVCKTIMKKNIFQEFAYSEDKTTVNKPAYEELFASKTSKVRKLPIGDEGDQLKQRVDVLNRILAWRKDHEAPVDMMGCERLSDPQASVEVQKYQTLVSLMLSIQTKDETTSMCVNRLKKYGLTPESISKTEESKLIAMIYECNFNKRKAKHIIEVSRIIMEKGSVANTKEQLLKYPGVGIKIAMIYLNVAEGKNQGIGVDTHVHRITNRLGWVKTDNPNNTETRLQEKFPRKYWEAMNIAFVGFGQLLCNAKKPLCNQCPVSKQCPSSSLKW